jgi:hypothetical protein
VVLAFVLLLASLLTWWSTTRRDARFVGTWNFRTGYGDPTLQVVWTFRSDGLARFSGLWPGSLWFRWDSDDSGIVLRGLEPGPLVEGAQKVADVLDGSTYLNHGSAEVHYKIRSVSFDRIVLVESSSGSEITLTRITE